MPCCCSLTLLAITLTLTPTSDLMSNMEAREPEINNKGVENEEETAESALHDSIKRKG